MVIGHEYPDRFHGLRDRMTRRQGLRRPGALSMLSSPRSIITVHRMPKQTECLPSSAAF